MADLTAPAVFSPCERYRYLLRRDIDPLFGARPCVFIMLNPSTADAVQDDPTIRKCKSFARMLDCNPLIVTNIFALRSTDPRGLWAVDDPIGPENDAAIQLAAEYALLNDGVLIAAWGNHGHYRDRAATVMSWFGDRLLCLAWNEKGRAPKHPLYVPYAAELRAVADYAGRAALTDPSQGGANGQD